LIQFDVFTLCTLTFQADQDDDRIDLTADLGLKRQQRLLWLHRMPQPWLKQAEKALRPLMEDSITPLGQSLEKLHGKEDSD
jgi:hypothetical protein